MKINFTKMHALGNNYIYVNQMKENIPEHLLSSLAIRVSNVRTGIGSDGLILICASKTAHVRMRVFNSDGSEAKNCGNGLRCVAKYVYERGIVKEDHFTIETLGGLVTAHVHQREGRVEQISIDMGKPSLTKSSLPMLGAVDEAETAIDCPIEIEGQQYTFTGVSMGNPHAVFFVEDAATAPVGALGPLVEKHPLFPEWTNVEFVSVAAPNELDFRVWERGSGITYACGTGACAAVVAAAVKKKIPQNTHITVHLLGGDLDIIWKEDQHVWMTGPAEFICQGEYWFQE